MNRRIISFLLAVVMVLGLVFSPGMTAEAWAGTAPGQNSSGTVETGGNPFTDVPEGIFYHVPVLWALERGITTGATATTFNPEGVCQRAAVVTFLWRAAGSPEPNAAKNPFVDVKASDFFYKAVLWAVEKGITNGTDANHFGPYGVCNRAQVVTFLHRAKGSPTPTNMDLPFTDVSAGVWYAAPVAWAVDNGITNGLSATEFGPDAACNRAQVVTFLYRAYSVCAHTGLQAVEAKEATCTEDGNCAYWYCSDCDAYFSDADAAAQITYEDTILAAGHTPGAPATCTEDQVCTVCGALIDEAKGHTVVIDPAVESTCSSTGLTEGSHCSVCSEVLVAQVEVPKKDHTPGADATCTEEQTCTVCGEVIKSENGHIPGTPATCTEPQKCVVCETVLAEATGHSLTYVEERDPVDAKDPGNRAYWQCTACNKCYLDENTEQEIALKDIAWEIYLIYFFDLENDTYTVGAYKQSEVLFLKNIRPVEMKGYDFNGWHTGQNFTKENKISVIPAGNTQNINLYANRSLHEYTISLLGLGREETWTYNIVSGKRLTTPKWKESAGQGDCLIFSHWSDENGNEITEIPAGEIGDRTIEANWIYKENYAVSNKDKYTYVGGVSGSDGKYSFIYEIGAIKNIVLSKQHTYPFDGLTEHTVSETKTYTVGQSEGREAAKTISEIVSSATAKAEIERHTSTHQEGWEVGAKWKPEVEFAGVKVSAWEFSGGYSSSDTDTYEEAGFSSEQNYQEDGTENEIRSTVDYYTEESVSRTVSDTFIPGVTPVGNYTWARLMDVKVYAIVTYNPYTGNYAFDVYSVPTNIYDGLLYTLPGDLDYEVNIVSGDVLDFEIPFEEIPEMFYTVEYDANGGTGEMHKSVHELGVSSALLPKSYTLKLEGEDRVFGFARTGYTFDGWTTSPDGAGQFYTDAFKISSDLAKAGETVKLYAHWVKNPYTIQYVANKPGHASADVQNMPADTDCCYDTDVTLGKAPTLTGWIFRGWYRDPNFNEYVGAPGALVENANLTAEHGGKATLYGHWEAEKRAITYHANDTSGRTKVVTVDYDSTYTMEGDLFGRQGFIFVGWSEKPVEPLAPDESLEDILTDLNYLVREDYTVYAVWAPISAGWNNGRSDSNNVAVRNDGLVDYWQTGLNREVLKKAGYTKVSISGTIRGQRIYDWWAKDWYIEFYDRVGNKAHEDTIGKFNYGGFETRNIQYTLNIDCIRDDGTIMVRFDHHGGDDERGQYRIGLIQITSTAQVG